MKKILSIDGGGMRGIIPVTLLSRIEKATNKPIRELFDLMAGSSTGGLISILLVNGLKAEKILDFYIDHSKNIFKDTVIDHIIDSFGKNIGADYDQKNLERVLTIILGDTRLKDVNKKGKAAILIPVFDLAPLDKGKPVNLKPKVYNSISAKDKNEKLVDIALRATAAPTYFPIREQRYIDGGIVINHPAMAALAFGINKDKTNGMNFDIKNLKVLSLGTGTANHARIMKDVIGDGDWGNLRWAPYLPDLINESNIEVSEYYVRQVLNINNNLNKRYLRIQPALNTIIKMDVKEKKVLKQIIGLAKKIKLKPILEFLEV